MRSNTFCNTIAICIFLIRKSGYLGSAIGGINELEFVEQIVDEIEGEI